MADFDYKEYTKQRDIAQKRIKRMQKAGVQIDVHIPTVKELRAGSVDFREQMGKVLHEFVSTGVSLSRQREKERVSYSPEQLRERKRQQARDYRRRKVAKEYERPAFPKKYQGYLKGLKTLGVDVPPSKLPAFFEYMDYRFAQGNVSKKYVFDIFVDDYTKMLQKGYKPDQILSDFQKFEADQAALSDRAENMIGISAEKAIGLWDKFIGE